VFIDLNIAFNKMYYIKYLGLFTYNPMSCWCTISGSDNDTFVSGDVFLAGSVGCDWLLKLFSCK